MAWSFGDGFDLYAATADMVNGYWDSLGGAGSGWGFTAGRFSGSQALSTSSNVSNLAKSSSVNDAVHHFVVSFRQTAAISGATLGWYFELFDGATAQCSVVFRSDGAILLASGAPNGTVLATYTGAFPVTSTWYAFEIEVVINNTTGSFTVRKNGNSVADFTATALDTQNSANAYANKLQVGQSGNVSSQQIDDLFWRSDASSVAWLGDLRCYARMPASDVTKQFTPLTTSLPLTPFALNSAASSVNTVARYTPFTPLVSGVIGTVTMTSSAVNAGNCKCTIFSAFGAAPGTPLGSATPLSNLPAGLNTFTFGTPVSVTAGTQYYVGFMTDTSATNAWPTGAGNLGQQQTGTTYAAFPPTNPSTGIATAIVCTLNISSIANPNSTMVSEAQQDGLVSYVYDSTPGDQDFYSVASIASTPATVIATTVRAYAQKSDAGTRTMAVQLKSGGTTVASPTLVLTTSGFQWAWRTDIVDPNTSAPWTAAAVNNAQCGVKVIA